MSDLMAARALVEQLLADSAMFLDKDELEAWLDCFAEESKYFVIPRENREQNLPAAIISCPSKAILKDRIAVLRHANKFNPHYDCHILSGPRVARVTKGVAAVETNFMVIQSTKTGTSKLFCAGRYEDLIDVSGERAAFVERIAIIDTFAVPTLLATPV